MVLDLDILEGSHTGKNLAYSFFNVGEEFGILDKLLGFTTDNATNYDTFFEHLANSMKTKVKKINKAICKFIQFFFKIWNFRIFHLILQISGLDVSHI